jgi:predicted nucleic acid-binding Zn ribbon protein
MICCIVCGYPIPNEYAEDRLTCGDRCLTELNVRKEAAKLERRRVDQIKRKNYTIQLITEHFARILLEQDIPNYTSNIDIDRKICEQDAFVSKLNTIYRRRCVTATIISCGYTQYSTSNHGKKTYKLVEDRDILRAKLADIVGVKE